jgi:predicted RNA binding protein YcfA (HicA-like mRNA interferase family)
LTRISDKGEYHITVPIHKTLRIGTLNNILTDIASHLKKEKDDLIKELF